MDKINKADIGYAVEDIKISEEKTKFTPETDGDKKLVSLILQKQQQEIDKGQQEIERLKNDTAERKTFAIGVRKIIGIGLAFTAVMVVLYGLNVFSFDSVIICTLLGTTTANVISLGYILLKGLFPDGKKNKK